jgi:hypothetical protein
MARERYTPQDLDSRLKFVVGSALAGVLVITVAAVLYGLIFVTQPIGAQAENDKMFFQVLSSIATFITGALAGIMSVGATKGSSDEASTEEPTEF